MSAAVLLRNQRTHNREVWHAVGEPCDVGLVEKNDFCVPGPTPEPLPEPVPEPDDDEDDAEEEDDDDDDDDGKKDFGKFGKFGKFFTFKFGPKSVRWW